MSLLGAGANADELSGPGFLECLTTVPFGNLYLALEDGPMVFFSGANIDPDDGLTRALHTLGWSCQVYRGQVPEEAMAHLKEAVEVGPILVGPIDMGWLSYHPEHAKQAGADHFVAVLAIEGAYVHLHDPQGYPCAVLSHTEFLQAWNAEHLSYSHAPYTFRHAFRKVEQVSRQEMISRSLPHLRGNIEADPGGPVAYGGVRVFSLLANDVRGGIPASLEGHLLSFALPLAARRNVDAAAFLREADRQEAANILEQQASLFGLAQYRGAHHQWQEVAAIMEQLGALEEKLVILL